MKFLELPTAFVREVQRRVNADHFDGTVGCADVSSMPQLTVSLRGQGDETYDFVMRPEDYINDDFELPFLDLGRCSVGLLPHEDDDDGVEPECRPQ